MEMEIKEAIQIVFDLAIQNALVSDETDADDALTKERFRQQVALECVSNWARHALDVRL